MGYGCTTCIGNSGPLPAEIDAAIEAGDLTVSSVLSGNRNFEGRIHNKVRANWLVSPPLVVAFALAGTTRINLTTDPIGKGANGQDIYLKDLWPSNTEVAAAVAEVSASMFQSRYADVFSGDDAWKSIKIPPEKTYQWSPTSTYIQHPPFFSAARQATDDIDNARILALFGEIGRAHV